MQRLIGCVFAMALVGCGAGNPGTPGDDGGIGSGTDAAVNHDARLLDAPTVSGAKPTIFTIVLENHDYKEIVSAAAGDAASTNAPYINSLIADYALATNYKDTNHPSTPNYLHLISGSDQYPGVLDVLPTQAPYFPASQPNLGTQLVAANITWRSYQESMGTPCKLVNSGEYVPRHDPFVYFTDQVSPVATCDANNVDYTSFAADLATDNYRYMWITPNLLDDGHDPSGNPTMALKTSDTWLSTEVPKILASPGYQAGGVLFITWDEAEGRSGDNADLIPMIVVSKRVKTAGMTTATAYTHSSYLATVEDILGLPRLATVTATPSMMTELLNP